MTDSDRSALLLEREMGYLAESIASLEYSASVTMQAVVKAVGRRERPEVVAEMLSLLRELADSRRELAERRCDQIPEGLLRADLPVSDLTSYVVRRQIQQKLAAQFVAGVDALLESQDARAIAGNQLTLSKSRA
ncbi:hypothetical protein ABIE51_001719 [Lysobacter sp. OAE881]|uniref:hypothetical protein n=1 Tax=Lysobacter sp. OAE881 TaxID=2663813 RepID=UPI00178946E3